jgi:hypothetical protein
MIINEAAILALEPIITLRALSVPPSPSTHRPQRLSIKTFRIIHEPSSQFTSERCTIPITTKSQEK